MDVVAHRLLLRSSGQSSTINSPRQQISRLSKPKPKAATNDDGFTHLEGTKPKPLDKRFADIKANLVKLENYAAVQASWDRLIKALRERALEIESAGSNVIYQLCHIYTRPLLIAYRLYRVLNFQILTQMAAFQKTLPGRLKRQAVAL